MFARGSLDRQRELFRTGQRAQAEVVNVIETRAFVPARCVPQPGDLIQIAVGDNGSDVALNTDERYNGPPGQALVFTTPPELAAQRPPEESLSDQVAGQQAKLAASQERTAAGMARIEAYRAGETPPSSADVTAEGAAQTGAASAPADDLVARLSEQMAGMKRRAARWGSTTRNRSAPYWGVSWEAASSTWQRTNSCSTKLCPSSTH
jgi:hypothetical protein